MFAKISAALVGVSLLLSVSAQAAMVNSFTNAVLLEDFEGLGFVSSGPVALAGGQVTASSNVLATYDYLPVDLGSNGAWGLDGFVGIGDYYNFTTMPSPSDSLTFTFANGLAGVGANYSIYKADGNTGSLLLEVLDLYGSVLESTTAFIDFQSPNSLNASAFYGFSRATSDIYGLRVTGDGFVIDDLTANDVTAVPIPAALPLFLSAIGMLMGFRARRKTSK